MQAISFHKTQSPLPRPGDGELGFGRFFTDHLFRAEWIEGRGWHDARVEPYATLALDPATSAIHYGQSVFDGLKIFRRPTGLALFRGRKHAERFAESARRLAMPPVDPDLLLDGLRALARADADWMPRTPGTALYVRPVLFARESFLGVRPARAYTLLTFLSPVGAYFAGPPRPLRIWVERHRCRAALGMGSVKASANYAASLLAAQEAKARGFDQVLWLDAAEHRWLEEIGTMNVFAQLEEALVTPPLDGAILPGVTRDAIATLARDRGLTVEERRVSLDELASAHAAGRLRAMFGTGTAAVLAPIGELIWDATSIALPTPEDGGLAEALRTELIAIQTGTAPDPHAWIELIRP